MVQQSIASACADIVVPLSSSVTAAEIVRNFSEIRQQAFGAPVIVTHHGKDTHVLCSAALFRALTRRREALDDDAVALQLVQLAAWIDQGLILADTEGRVLHANPALLCLFPYDPARLIGRPLFEAIPELAGSIAEPYLRRAIGARETRLFEMPSPFRTDAWLQCRHAPVGDGTVLLFRDISSEIRDTNSTRISA
jgi:PAS domain S-box-containing protein